MLLISCVDIFKEFMDKVNSSCSRLNVDESLKKDINSFFNYAFMNYG